MEVETIASNAQNITCRVKMESNHFCLSFIHGFNDGMARRSLWRHLINLQGSISHGPWLLAGDFNIILQPNESSNFNGSQRTSSETREFQECL